jgi:hypothetical protein
MAYVHCPGATTEAQQAGEAQQSEPSKPTVAYSGKGRVWCLRCPHPADENVPLNANDVNAWDLCPSCGRHVVDVAQAQQEADHA